MISGTAGRISATSCSLRYHFFFLSVQLFTKLRTLRTIKSTLQDFPVVSEVFERLVVGSKLLLTGSPTARYPRGEPGFKNCPLYVFFGGAFEKPLASRLSRLSRPASVFSRDRNFDLSCKRHRGGMLLRTECGTQSEEGRSSCECCGLEGTGSVLLVVNLPVATLPSILTRLPVGPRRNSQFTVDYSSWYLDIGGYRPQSGQWRPNMLISEVNLCNRFQKIFWARREREIKIQ